MTETEKKRTNTLIKTINIEISKTKLEILYIIMHKHERNAYCEINKLALMYIQFQETYSPHRNKFCI